MKNIEIKQLAHFNNALRRDVLVDALRRPTTIPDKELIAEIIDYGNRFLERERELPEHDGAIIWFDVHFGEPAVVGLTWAYNPHAPFDDLNGANYFWRLWTEIGASDDEVRALQQAQQDFAAYTLQHLSA